MDEKAVKIASGDDIIIKSNSDIMIVESHTDPNSSSMAEIVPLTPEEDKKLLKRIDLCLMPLMFITSLVQYLDEQSIGFVSIMGIIEDLNLTGTQYSWSNSVYYFGYLASAFFSGFFLVRFPIGKFLAACFFGWAICIACTAATTNFTGLMIVRFFLGTTEATMMPGFSLITSMWYKRKEHPMRHILWFLGISLGVMFGGLLGYGIAHIQGGIGPWKWLFIIFGLITFAWALVMLWLFPDTPDNARWLSPKQRQQAVIRVRENLMSAQSDHFKWNQAWEALLDIRVWLLAAFTCSLAICSGSLNAFAGLVLVGFGFDMFETYLFFLAIGFVHGCFGLGAAFACSKFPNSRCYTLITMCTISLVGSMLVQFGPNQTARVIGFLIFFAFASSSSIALSVVASNVAGFTKKSVASGIFTVSFCVGNLIGPFLFFEREAPEYRSGFIGTATCLGAAILLAGIYRLSAALENKRRDQLYGAQTTVTGGDEEESQWAHAGDETDKGNPHFRYVL